MVFNDTYFQTLYQGLKTLSQSVFPKKCNTCGRVYRNEDEFTRLSQPVGSGSGLKESIGDDDRPVIDLFRNCECGSTLMESFSDRRDMSENGRKRREVFSKIQGLLVKKGMSPTDARTEILNFMAGKPSPILEKLGIRVK